MFCRDLLSASGKVGFGSYLKSHCSTFIYNQYVNEFIQITSDVNVRNPVFHYLDALVQP